MTLSAYIFDKNGPVPPYSPPYSPTSPPTASFTYVDNGDGTATFTDTSTNNPTSWAWDFDNGAGSSTLQNPTFDFGGAGTYTVELTVTNAYGSDIATNTTVEVTAASGGRTVQVLYAEGINQQTTSPHATFRTACTIPAEDFNPNTKYLIIAAANAGQQSSANQTILRLLYGANWFTDTELSYEQTTTTQFAQYGWCYILEQGATPSDVHIEFASDSTQVVTVKWAGIMAINLDDLGTENVDYYYSDAHADTIGINAAGEFDGSSITFTPNGTDEWLIIGQGVIGSPATNSNHLVKIRDSVDGVLVGIDVEGEDQTNDIRGYLLMTAFAPTAVSHTIKMVFERESAYFDAYSSRIAAIRLNAFPQHLISRATGQEAPAASPSWTTTRTLSPTPDVTNDWILWGYFSNDVGLDTDVLNTRLQVNPDGSGLVSKPNYGDDAPGKDGWDATDITPNNLFTVTQLTSGASRTVNLDVSMASGTAARVQDRTLVAIGVSDEEAES